MKLEKLWVQLQQKLEFENFTIFDMRNFVDVFAITFKFNERGKFLIFFIA